MSARVVCLALAAMAVSCNNVDFAPASELHNVRILASAADKPYARPGETVKIDVLAYDARVDRTRPMKLFWIPSVCVNPNQDLYYACFSSFAGTSLPAVGGGGGSVTLAPGTDLSPYLPQGTSYSITLPQNIITSHPPVNGSDGPYGLAIVFNMACAGHVELVAIDSNNPQAVPFGCFDDNHNQLGPDQYVLGFTRVYAYDTRRNANPTIRNVLLEGNPVAPAVGLVLDRCTTSLRRDCPDHKLDVDVPPEDQEVQEGSSDGRKEQIWADYYADVGQLDGDARLLYDPTSGKVSGSEDKYKAPNDPGDGNLFVVVHDNRGGASWVQLAIHTR